jgi:hypothetical protein
LKRLFLGSEDGLSIRLETSPCEVCVHDSPPNMQVKPSLNDGAVLAYGHPDIKA